MEEAPKFTRHVWFQLWRLIRPYFFGRTPGKAWTQLGVLITLTAVEVTESVIRTPSCVQALPGVRPKK